MVENAMWADFVGKFLQLLQFLDFEIVVNHAG